MRDSDDVATAKRNSALAELIVRSATDFAIVTSTPDGIISSWSPGAENVMGWTASEAVGRPVALFFTPEDIATDQMVREMNVARSGGAASDERWHVKKGGGRFWASGEMQPLEEDGQVVGFLKILRDRTEQHELARRLAAAQGEAGERMAAEQARLREMFEAAPGFIAVFRGPELVFEMINPSYSKLIGHRDVIGKTIREALPEVEGQGYFEKLESVYASGEALTEHTMPVMLQQAPGAEPELRYVDYVFQPMHDATGAVDGIFLEGFDVTVATLARAASAKMAAEQAAILGQLSEGVIATDAEGRISFVNAAAERLHGVARLDVAPDAYSDTYSLLTEDGAPYPPADLPLTRAVLHGETVSDARWRIRRPDGSEVVAIGNAQPVVADTAQVGAVLTLRDDTERSATELALRRSEARIRSVLEGMDEAFLKVDHDFRIIEINEAAVRIDGRKREEVVDRKLLEVWPETEHLPNWPMFLEAMRTGTPGHVEYRHFSDMHDIWLEVRAYPVEHGLAIFYRDVTERRRVQEALQASEAKFQAITDSVDQMIWSTRPDGYHDYYNKRWYDYTGMAPGSTDGEEWADMFHPDDQPRTWATWNRSLATGEPYNMEYRLRNRSGTYRWVVGRALPVRDESGAITRWYGTCTDIHDVKVAEDRLRETEERYRVAVRATTDAVWDWDLRTDQVQWNEALQTTFGYRSDEVGPTGDWWIGNIHPDDARRVDESIHAAIDGPDADWSSEYRFRRADGSYAIILDRGTVVRDAEGRATRMIGAMLDLSERRAAEEALAERERQFRELADNIPTLCWSARPDGHIYWYNRRWYEYTGTALETQEGWGWESVHHPAWIDHVVGGWSDAIAAGRPFEMTFPLKGADGRYRHFLTRVVPIRGEPTLEQPAGPVLRWFGTNTDVEDQRLADEALGNSEERYRRLFEAIDAGFYVSEAKLDDTGAMIDFLYLESNPAFERQSGLLNPVGKWVSELAPELEPHWFEIYGRVARDRETVRFENGSEALGRWFDVFAFPVDEPESLRMAVLFNDITPRRNAELRLTELNRTLETRVAETVAERDMIWRTSQDLFAVTTIAEARYTSVNPAWTEVLGWQAEELIGLGPSDLVHPDDMAPGQAGLAGLAKGEILADFDLRMRHKDGSYRWLSWTCVPHGDVFYASGRDVTARKELEEQLRQSQKMEAVGQLTGGIAHDFNNLLTIVSGNIDMARRSLGADGDARALRSLGNAAKGADRAAALTQRLLAFSRRQPLQPRATDVNKLITGMTELLDRALGETVDLQVVAGAGLWRVEVDPNQLENAILNLAVNARDAMPGGGKLTVETSNSAIDEAYAAAQREVLPGQYVMICVTDTGEGMPADVVAKAFDPFFSTKDVGKGTGLGLSQVYGYVKQSGGHVKIYSESGEGTTVKLYLPRLIADMNAAEEEEAVLEAPTQGQESILVVEDDDDVRIYTVDSLRELGYRVLEAHDGASALRLLERQEEPPSLLLTDVVMPGMSGRELADAAHALYPDMQILYTTGYARNAIVHGGRLDPGVELLPKPFTFEALAGKIREVIEKVAVERALVIDPVEVSREASAALLGELGFAAEKAGTVREALGKLRAASGRFDAVILSDAVPVGNLDAVIAELHAVRNDLPVLILGKENAVIADRCVGVLAYPFDAPALRNALRELRVRCVG